MTTLTFLSMTKDVLRYILLKSGLDDCTLVACKSTCRDLKALLITAAWKPNFMDGFCGCAASLGYLSLLQWAHAHGVYLDDSVCNEAARCGHFQLVRWAHANGVYVMYWDTTPEEHCTHSSTHNTRACSFLLCIFVVCNEAARRWHSYSVVGAVQTKTVCISIFVKSCFYLRATHHAKNTSLSDFYVTLIACSFGVQL